MSTSEVDVAVIMPAWRAAGSLPRSVASVQAQVGPRWTLLIAVDGRGDEDATAALARDLADGDRRIEVLDAPGWRTGAAASRNRAMARARGRWIAFLDADDLWLPGKLERQVKHLDRVGGAFGYTAFRRRHVDAPEGTGRTVRVPATITRAQLLRGNVVSCATAMLDRDRLASRMGPLAMPELEMRQDYAFWLDVLGHVPMAYGLDEVLAEHVRRPGSLSSGRLRAIRATWAMYRGHAGLGRLAAVCALGSHLSGRLLRR